MCGIGGILARGAGLVSEDELLRLRDAQAHRGPDDAGCWLADDRSAGLVHRRLSIIDLSPSGHQPMVTADGALRIVFNGEIYNHRTLRRELEERGHVFRSHSDTETILHGYREWGDDVLTRLRGMFAFALRDESRERTLLARDPLGIKPLYWLDDGRRIVFASELRALRPFRRREIDPEGLVTFLLWGSIASPSTIFAGVRALPPGHRMVCDAQGAKSPEAYYRVEDAFARPPDDLSEEDAARHVARALRDSVRHHLEADVPVGAFLSGGVDSSALVGLLAELHGGPIRTVTLVFDDPELDEGALASQAARCYGTEHHTVRIGIEEVRDRLGEAVDALDQPTVDGVNTFFVAEATVRAGLKVAVSGVGGDELFGGYTSFRHIPALLSVERGLGPLAALSRAIAGNLEPLRLPRGAAKLVRAARYGSTPWGAYFAERGLFSVPQLRRLLAEDLHPWLEVCDPARWLAQRVPLACDSPLDRVSLLEVRQYLQSQLLRDTDAASMAHSLEVRTPLVDSVLVDELLRVPAAMRQAGPAKRLLRASPKPPVPDALWNRRKQGFTLPFETWLRHGGVPLAPPRDGLLRQEEVRAVEAQFRAGRLHWSRLWALFALSRFLDD